MHWWCHHTWHQSKLFWVFFFLEDSRNKFRLCRTETKDQSFPALTIPSLVYYMGLYNIQQSADETLNAWLKNGLCLCDALQVQLDGIIKAIPHCVPKFLKSSPSFQNTSNQIKSGKQGWRLFVRHPVSASFVLILLPASLSAHILGSTSTLHAYSKRMEKKGGKQLKRHCALANLEHYTVDKAKLM